MQSVGSFCARSCKRCYRARVGGASRWVYVVVCPLAGACIAILVRAGLIVAVEVVRPPDPCEIGVDNCDGWSSTPISSIRPDLMPARRCCFVSYERTFSNVQGDFTLYKKSTTTL